MRERRAEKGRGGGWGQGCPQGGNAVPHRPPHGRHWPWLLHTGTAASAARSCTSGHVNFYFISFDGRVGPGASCRPRRARR